MGIVVGKVRMVGDDIRDSNVDVCNIDDISKL
jgi:hypothetical protein